MAKMTKAQARRRLDEAMSKVQRVFLSSEGGCMSMKEYNQIANTLKKAKNKLFTRR